MSRSVITGSSHLKDIMVVKGAPLIGAIVYWNIHTDRRKTSLREFTEMCKNVGVATTLSDDVPARHYFSYAWRHCRPSIKSESNTERRVALMWQQEDSKESIVLVVRQDVDKTKKASNFSVEDKIILDKATGRVYCQNNHPLSKKVLETYHSWRGYPTYELVHRDIMQDFDNWRAIRLKPTGGVYFVLARYYDEVRRKAKALSEAEFATIYDLPVYDVAGTGAMTAVRDGAKQSLADELEELRKAVADFTEDTKGKALSRRLQEFQELNRKITAYEEALKISLEELKLESFKMAAWLRKLGA